MIKGILKTIRKRLFMLGYLERDSGQAQIGAILKAGICKFQEEVRFSVTDFSVDGWVGDETWTALQELVSFEEPSNLERWYADEVPCLALKRSIQLRLFAHKDLPFPWHALNINPEHPVLQMHHDSDFDFITVVNALERPEDAQNVAA